MEEYTVIKCINCGYSIQDFGEKLEKHWKLKVIYDKKNEEVVIRGNAQGLKFLAGACLAVIGKNDPSGHILLQWQMNNLQQGSVQAVVEYSDNANDYR